MEEDREKVEALTIMLEAARESRIHYTKMVLDLEEKLKEALQE